MDVDGKCADEKTLATSGSELSSASALTRWSSWRAERRRVVARERGAGGTAAERGGSRHHVRREGKEERAARGAVSSRSNWRERGSGAGGRVQQWVHKCALCRNLMSHRFVCQLKLLKTVV